MFLAVVDIVLVAVGTVRNTEMLHNNYTFYMFSVIMYMITLILGISHSIRTCAIIVRVELLYCTQYNSASQQVLISGTYYKNHFHSSKCVPNIIIL